MVDEVGAASADGALADAGASVRMVTPGTKTRADDLLAARVIVATPAELCQLLAPKEGEGDGAGEGALNCRAVLPQPGVVLALHA